MTKTALQSQLEDLESLEALKSVVETAAVQREFAGFATESVRTKSPGDIDEGVASLRAGRADFEHPMMAEAIVVRKNYPSLLIQDGDYEEPQNPHWRNVLNPHRDAILESIQSVGRVDLINHPSYKWVGTLWRVADDVLITNRHVAEVFASARNNRTGIRAGVDVLADFKEEHGSADELEYLVDSIIAIEPADTIDMALLRVRAGGQALPGEPIKLRRGRTNDEYVGVIGYPAKSPSNPQDDMSRIFGDIYDVKRLAPGKVMDEQHSADVFTHNCTTLGGNSGSAVIDIETGAAVGLHYAGQVLTQNYAVKTEAIEDAMRRRHVQGFSIEDGQDESGGNGRTGARASDTFSDRKGYKEDFLGDSLKVPLPRLNAIQATRVAEAENGDRVLRYRHFSAVLNKERKLAYFTAVNIDGESLQRPRRIKKFFLDPRLPAGVQAGEALYKANPFDRGHLIRRLDPCWGSRDEAKEANRDSMYFPNIAPQHKDLNQRVWLELEDHVLSLSDERDLKVSVFVGCLFDDLDPEHEPTGIRVPMAFWKIVSSVGRKRSGRRSRRILQTQAFLLRQNHLVRDRDLEAVFGEGFELYQLPVEELERLTGLDFHVMKDADTLAIDDETRQELTQEAVAVGQVRGARDAVGVEIRTLDDVIV